MKKEKNTKSKKPIYKKPIFIILEVFIIFTFIGAILNTDTTINNNQPVSNLNDDNNEMSLSKDTTENNEISTTQEEQNISDYLDLKTADEVKKAYDENFEKIMNKEKIENAKRNF